MGGTRHGPVGNSGDYKKRSVYIDGDLHIFTSRCNDCGEAWSVNVKDLKSKGHTTTIICPKCGVIIHCTID